MLPVIARAMRSRARGYGTLAVRGVEVGAALLVIVFGIALLAGYIASERMGLL
jgi:nickel/cobalt transporter (NicO) family protein